MFNVIILVTTALKIILNYPIVYLHCDSVEDAVLDQKDC